MGKVYLQVWEYLDNETFLNAGATLHLSLRERDNFISKNNKNRYIGLPQVFIADMPIYKKVKKNKTIKINEAQLNNMINSCTLMKFNS